MKSLTAKQSFRDKIQLMGAFCFRTISKIMWIFPIRNNRVSMVAHLNKPFSCNPKYIAEYLLSEYKNKFEIVFAVKKPKSESRNDILFVKTLGIKQLYYFCTSKVIVCNGGMPTYLPKRKTQYVINTWHGGGAYKSCNPDIMKYSASKMKLCKYKSKCTDLALSSCKVFSDAEIPDIIYNYKGEILNCGMPRNDIFFKNVNDVVRDSVCSNLKINNNEIIILYAPTFRGAINNLTAKAGESAFNSDMDVKMVIKSIERRFGKKAVMINRAHQDMHGLVTQDGCIDATSYPDMQELLCAADILISDYSSTIWDFSLMKKPCFLYCPDLDYYMNDDRGTYTPIETWPGILCRSNEEIEQAILHFDEAEYVKKVEKHHRDLGSYETGHACEQVCRRIAEVCGVEEEI